MYLGGKVQGKLSARSSATNVVQTSPVGYACFFHQKTTGKSR